MDSDEAKLYGALTRCPKGYDKLDILGKGGCAVVWLGKNEKTGRKVGIKQFPKTQKNDSNYRSGLIEAKMNGRFFDSRGEPFDAYKNHPGIKSIC